MHFDILSLLNFVCYSINSYWICKKQKRNKTLYLCRRNSNIIKSGIESGAGYGTEGPLRLLWDQTK